MSLHQLANHMSAQGRGPDSTLVHMSPREVSGLQSLAMANGGTLTINPETGLPEAGFLDSLLPTLLGGAATFFSGGAITPFMAALGVGGLTALTRISWVWRSRYRRKSNWCCNSRCGGSRIAKRTRFFRCIRRSNAKRRWRQNGRRYLL